MRQRRVVSALAIPLVLAFVAASCGSDDSSSDVATIDDTTAAEDTAAPDETAAPDDEAAVTTDEEVETSIVEFFHELELRLQGFKD